MLDRLAKWRTDSRQRNAQRRELEQEMHAAKRLPPGQRVTLKFPVLHLGKVPPFDPTTWSLKLWGAVEQPMMLSWADFQKLPRRPVTLDLHCVTQWSKFDTLWEGVALRDLIDETGIKLHDDVSHLIQVAANGYKTNLPLSIALQDNFLLATHYNGQPLDPEHGYPLRGVMGHIVGRKELEDVYLWKGVKWLRGLKFTTEDQPGTWEVGGYHNDGDVWREERWGVRF